MNKKERLKKRHALTLTALFYVFFVMLVTVVISFALITVLLSMGVIPSPDTPRKDVLYIVRFMAVVNLLAGICVTALTNKILLRYINRVINAMNRLAEGDFKTRLDFGRPLMKHPTFMEISDSFNRMAEELDNTEMLRSDFINNFSHEFKTPIVSIAGFTKLLKRGNLTQEQRKEYLDVIEDESMRLSSMATNVLNMTKVENQTILTNVTSFNLSEQIRSCILLLEPKWTRKNIELDILFKEYTISANEELLKQVWINLIENAIKFSPDYGMVKVNVKEQGEMLSVSVLNLGSEIPPEQQDRIWGKFYQADESHASEGNGIGLALVKRVVELHKGSVSVKSEHNATVFTVELPKEQ